MESVSDRVNRKPVLGWVLFLVTLVAVFILGLLASRIMERRTEAVFAYTPQTEIRQWEPRNEVWGQNFPKEYQSYMQTADTTFRSKYNGGVMIDMLAVDPRLVVLWAGYGFAKDYNQGRGHYYAVEDLRDSLRTGGPVDAESGPMPATCWTCKSPDVPRMMQEVGVAEFYTGKWARWGEQISNHIGCADCHDPETMNLQISRPPLIEAYERTGKDITQAGHQEMRSLVCAQCHVEYYFKKEPKNYLTLPWAKGTSPERMLAYYDEFGFRDYVHPVSKTPIVKSQHPDYELYLTGIHAYRNVSCADCHMPYRSEGGVKFTDHHVQSPLLNIANSCAVCHRWSEEEIRTRVEAIQAKVAGATLAAARAVVKAHFDTAAAMQAGATDEELAAVRGALRSAQFKLDYVASSNGVGFHSPQEAMRILGDAANEAQQVRLMAARLLAKKGISDPPKYPDVSTRRKAWAVAEAFKAGKAPRLVP